MKAPSAGLPAFVVSNAFLPCIAVFGQVMFLRNRKLETFRRGVS